MDYVSIHARPGTVFFSLVRLSISEKPNVVHLMPQTAIGELPGLGNEYFWDAYQPSTTCWTPAHLTSLLHIALGHLLLLISN